MSGGRWNIPPLKLPRSERRIGVIGAGGIVENAHLPAYRTAGFRVTALADVDRSRAERLARDFDIPHVFADARSLIDCDEVDVVDVAIPEHGREGLFELLLAAGKPTLAQKPLAYELDRALEWVDRFETAGVPLAVNQNARWAPPFRAVRHAVEQGWLGELFDIRWTMRNTADFQPWARDTWYSRDERFQVLSWSIHHLDLFRYWLDDEAIEVFCRLPRRPGQHFRGDVMASVFLGFSRGCSVTMVDSNASTPGRPEIQEVDVDGTEGSAYARVSEPTDFALWRLEEVDAQGGEAPAHRPVLEGKWYPDGFGGSMGEFLRALEEGRECTVSGRRNVGTLRLVDACYRSARTGEVVTLAP